MSKGSGYGGIGENKQKEIIVLLPEHPYVDLIISKLPEFEEMTEIKVEVIQLNESALTEKQVNAIAEEEFTADVFMTRPMTESLLFLNNDWMMPLGGFDMSDYPDNTIEIGVKNGIPHFVPVIVEWQVLYYRKDLLQAAGLSVPANFEELEYAAVALNKDGVAGFAARGAGSPAVSQVSSFIYNFGGRYIENGAAAFDSPEAVEAIRLYGRLLGLSGPNGITTMSWNEIMPIFRNGNLAMWTDASVFYGQLIDPEFTQIPAENIGVASVPRGPVDDKPYIVTSWGMSISSKTEDSESAMEFLTWATGEDMAKEAMLANIPMARISVWNDPTITTHINPEIVDTMIHASMYGNPYPMPFMTSIVEARELIGEVISESIYTGGTSPRLRELATQKTAEVNQLLKDDGEYGTAK
jgi:multiple sugar transport system substrate-binding protein